MSATPISDDSDALNEVGSSAPTTEPLFCPTSTTSSPLPFVVPSGASETQPRPLEADPLQVSSSLGAKVIDTLGPATTALAPHSGASVLMGEGSDLCPDKPAIMLHSLRAMFGCCWMHNEQIFIRPCGIIIKRMTFYGSETMLQVLVCPIPDSGYHIMHATNVRF